LETGLYCALSRSSLCVATRNRATLKRVALNAVRIVTGKNSIRHTMRDAVLDVRVLADTLNHMPVA